MSLWPQNASQMHCWPELPSILGFLHGARQLGKCSQSVCGQREENIVN